MDRLKIYGERNTGTNFLKELVSRNMEVEILKGLPDNTKYAGGDESVNLYFNLFGHENLGWKHSRVNMEWVVNHEFVDSIFFVCLVKNPYSFLVSLYRRPYHFVGEKQLEFSNFVKHSWETQERDNAPKVIVNAVELWNVKCRSYLELKDKLPNQTWILNYEELLKNQRKFINTLKRRINAPMKGEFAPVVKSTKSKNKEHKDYLKYYTKEWWRSKLDADNLKHINEHLDPELVNQLGYNLIKEL